MQENRRPSTTTPPFGVSCASQFTVYQAYFQVVSRQFRQFRQLSIHGGAENAGWG